MNELEKLKSEIEAFLQQHQMTPTQFGKDALKDPGFVFGLREGREPRFSTCHRVREFMKARTLQAAE